jgi:selenocysteine lyase/cysteine desulfurase
MQRDHSLPRRNFLSALTGAALLSIADLKAFASGTSQATSAENPTRAVNWDRIQSDFNFEQGLTYLNTSSMGAMPFEVQDGVSRVMQEVEKNPTARGYGDLEHAMDDVVRAKLAALVGCDLKEMIATNSTTDGMNVVAQGIGLKAGERVLTTDQEHPGGSECWNYFARRYGVVIDRVKLPVPPKSVQEILDMFQERFTPSTRVVSVSHITTTTGTLMPIREIAELASAHKALLVVDGAQALGSMQVDVKSLGCDAYASCGHKWMSGPTGTGVLYINQKARHLIDPIFLQGGENAYSGSTGVRNIPGILGLGASIDYMNALRHEAIWKHNMALREMAYEGLQKIKALKILSPISGPFAAPMVSVSLPEGRDNHAFQKMLLEKYKIQVKVLPADSVAPRGIRVSPHIFNDEEDVQRFLTAMQKELSA